MADPLVATYSIAACDLEARQWGVAVQSKFLAVGSVVPWAEPEVGAIATQAYANPSYGPNGLALLREGLNASAVVDRLTSEDEVRRHVTDFNERVVAARYRLPEGPPLVTMPREVDATVEAWRARRTARIAEQRRKAREALAQERATPSPKRRWWRRRG